MKILPRKTRPTKHLKRPRGVTGRGAKLFLRTVTVSGAGVLRFSYIPIMCLRVADNIDAVIWEKNAKTVSTLFLALIAWSGILLARNSFQLKNVSVGRTVFSHALPPLLFKTVMGETAPFIKSAY